MTSEPDFPAEAAHPAEPGLPAEPRLVGDADPEGADPAGPAPPEEDAGLAPPAFFLSYAHSRARRPVGLGREPRRWVITFFDDLSESVADLVGLPTGLEPGFIDLSMHPGRSWSDDLLEAVGSSQVCVALLSPRYVGSEWCGMEWSAFSRRTVIRRDNGRQVRRLAIIPVIWAPLSDDRVPAAIQVPQRFVPTGMPREDYGALYEREGVLGLMHIEPDAYDAVVWRLAREISTFCDTHWVEPQVYRQGDLGNAFGEETP